MTSDYEPHIAKSSCKGITALKKNKRKVCQQLPTNQSVLCVYCCRHLFSLLLKYCSTRRLFTVRSASGISAALSLPLPVCVRNCAPPPVFFIFRMPYTPPGPLLPLPHYPLIGHACPLRAESLPLACASFSAQFPPMLLLA